MAIYENALLHIEESEDELSHHGIKGQKWGERRYQYDDGSYTPLGRERYGIGQSRESGSEYDRVMKRAVRESNKLDRYQNRLNRERIKNSGKIAKLDNKAAKLRSKEYGILTSRERAADLEYRARKLESRADKLASKSRYLEAKLAKSEALIAKYNDKLVNMGPEAMVKGKSIVDKLVESQANFVDTGKKERSKKQA